MGLDMYAKTTKAELDKDVDFDLEKLVDQSEDLCYWRKHPNLHGWMRALYYEKGGANPQFNVNGVRLNEEDLDRLEADIKEGNLPKTQGFFFGESQGDEEEKKYDLKFVEDARAAIKDGKIVYYFAWW